MALRLRLAVHREARAAHLHDIQAAGGLTARSEGITGGELEFAGVVPAAAVQRLASDARVRRNLIGPKSAVINVGLAQRLSIPATRDALRARGALLSPATFPANRSDF